MKKLALGCSSLIVLMTGCVGYLYWFRVLRLEEWGRRAHSAVRAGMTLAEAIDAAEAAIPDRQYSYFYGACADAAGQSVEARASRSSYWVSDRAGFRGDLTRAAWLEALRHVGSESCPQLTIGVGLRDEVRFVAVVQDGRLTTIGPTRWIAD